VNLKEATSNCGEWTSQSHEYYFLVNHSMGQVIRYWVLTTLTYVQSAVLFKEDSVWWSSAGALPVTWPLIELKVRNSFKQHTINCRLTYSLPWHCTGILLVHIGPAIFPQKLDFEVMHWKQPLSTKVGNLFTNKQRSLGRYSSLADSDHGVCFLFVLHWKQKQKGKKTGNNRHV
jgi:hypothetical protein